ncbi:MAG: hypothetical protein FWF82_02190 [Oscillospiraceae bacterium]|nr:hypothetical protein [Oscillospiraceae bacterium]
MTDNKKIVPKTETVTKPATAPVAPATATAPVAAPVVKAPAAAPVVKAPATAPAKKPAAKPAVKSAAKPATKPAAKSASKPAAKSAAKSASKPAAKATAKKAPTKAPAKAPKAPAKKKVELDKTDVVKKALWDALSKSKAKKINEYVAVQVYAEGLDSFFIAVHEGTPMIERSYYQGHNGDFQATEKDLLAIAKGKYDFVKAVKSGAVNFSGRLSSMLKILDLFN